MPENAIPEKTGQDDAELHYSVTDGIGHIILNRPHRRNALTFGMYDRIKAICTTVGTDADADDVRVLIFSGGGDAEPCRHHGGAGHCQPVDGLCLRAVFSGAVDGWCHERLTGDDADTARRHHYGHSRSR